MLETENSKLFKKANRKAHQNTKKIEQNHFNNSQNNRIQEHLKQTLPKKL